MHAANQVETPRILTGCLTKFSTFYRSSGINHISAYMIVSDVGSAELGMVAAKSKAVRSVERVCHSLVGTNGNAGEHTPTLKILW